MKNLLLLFASLVMLSSCSLFEDDVSPTELVLIPQSIVNYQFVPCCSQPLSIIVADSISLYEKK